MLPYELKVIKGVSTEEKPLLLTNPFAQDERGRDLKLMVPILSFKNDARIAIDKGKEDSSLSVVKSLLQSTINAAISERIIALQETAKSFPGGRSFFCNEDGGIISVSLPGSFPDEQQRTLVVVCERDLEPQESGEGGEQPREYRMGVKIAICHTHAGFTVGEEEPYPMFFEESLNSLVERLRPSGGLAF